MNYIWIVALCFLKSLFGINGLDYKVMLSSKSNRELGDSISEEFVNCFGKYEWAIVIGSPILCINIHGYCFVDVLVHVIKHVNMAKMMSFV